MEHKDPPLPPGKKPPPPPPVPPKDAEKERVQELIKDSSAGGVPAVVALARPLAPALSVGLVVIQMTLPAIIIVVSAAVSHPLAICAARVQNSRVSARSFDVGSTHPRYPRTLPQTPATCP